MTTKKRNYNGRPYSGKTLNGRYAPDAQPDKAAPSTQKKDDEQDYGWLAELIPGDYMRLGGYVVGLVTVHPDAAAQVIDKHNKDNRDIGLRTVTILAKAMKDGSFHLNGEAVVFDENHNCSNGQHRMRACVDSGTPFQTFVIAGLPAPVFSTFDQHLKRTPKQVLKMRKEENPGILASAMTYLMTFVVRGLVVRPGGAILFTLDDLLKLLARHPRLRESAAIAAAADEDDNARRFSGPGMLCVLHYLMACVDRKAADEFFAALVDSNVPLTEEWSAVRMLNRDLVSAMAEKRKKFNDAEVAARVIKAWNLRRSGTLTKRLPWTVGEQFPLIDGWDYDEKRVPIGVAGGTF